VSAWPPEAEALSRAIEARDAAVEDAAAARRDMAAAQARLSGAAMAARIGDQVAEHVCREVRSLVMVAGPAPVGHPPLAVPDLERVVVAALLDRYARPGDLEGLERRHFSVGLLGLLFDFLLTAMMDGAVHDDASIAKAFEACGYCSAAMMRRQLAGLRMRVPARVGVTLRDAAVTMMRVAVLRQLQLDLARVEAETRWEASRGIAPELSNILDALDELVDQAREATGLPRGTR
jgi:hypothetical protein